MTDAQDRELEELDLPVLDIAVILTTLGDALDIDPWNITYTWGKPAGAPYTADRTDKGVCAMLDLLDEAIESSTQIPHINRALDILAGDDDD